MRAYRRVLLACLLLPLGLIGCATEPPIPASDDALSPFAQPVRLPTGAFITPTAADGAAFVPLNPDLPTRPDFVAGQAVTTVISPDGRTLLILTSGYNRNNGANGKRVAAESNEYVFVYDISGGAPVKRQVVQVPNTFDGLAFAPGGDAFYVSGGVDDNLHVYARGAAGFAESGKPIALGHNKIGLGSGVPPGAAGVAVSADGRRALVANFENDSVSLIDLAGRKVLTELDLRPGKIDPARRGVAGGEYPFWVAVAGNTKAYVTSQRDREVVVLDLAGDRLRVSGRIRVGGQPNKLLLDRAQRRLFVANGNSDRVTVIDTARDRVRGSIDTVAPAALFANRLELRGAVPNSLALSPDERTLYVTDGGLNAVAVIRLHDGDGDERGREDDDERGGDRDRDRGDHDGDHDRGDHDGDHDRGERLGRVVGLIPTGWYPNSVSVSHDGGRLFVVNGKSPAGPNDGNCLAPNATSAECSAKNRYIWQLTKAGFLTLPTPSPWSLARLSWQVAENNHFPAVERHPFERQVMEFLHSRIRHVVYVVKENRTYDQVLGDLPAGDGDPALTVFPRPITPNHHALAEEFVTLDRFLDSGEVSGDGWNWSVSARTTDQMEKTVPLNYGGRGVNYDWEGENRNVNVGLPDTAARLVFNPTTPPDPDLLPGAVDVAAPDRGDQAGTGYLWDNALGAGLGVRNYGFFGDLERYSLAAGDPALIPLERDPAARSLRVFFPAKASLQAVSDPFFRGFDDAFPDFWREREWEREFDQFVAHGDMPALTLVRLMNDHFGNFGQAIDGVNTPELQIADNDYAVGRLVERISHSRFAADTLIFVLEDDAQNGGDHVDAHRSMGFVIGPYVRRHAVVSTDYDTVNVVRTIEDVLGLAPIGINDGLARPMADLFEIRPRANDWAYTARVPQVLRQSKLPLPAATPQNQVATPERFARPTHDAAWWAREMAGQDFRHEDALDEPRFNRSLWRGLAGDAVPYPTVRHRVDLSRDREAVLRVATLPRAER